MYFLILSILCSVVILLLFKLADRLKIKAFDIIIINYFVAVIAGLAINFSIYKNISLSQSSWIIPALIIGMLFILNFYIMSITTKKSGMSITAISARIAVVLPVIFSILFYHEKTSHLKIIGIVASLAAIVFCAVRKNEKGKNIRYFYLPVLLFLISGITDTLIKYTQGRFLSDNNLLMFSVMLFGTAAVTGFIIFILSGNKPVSLLTPSKLIFGICLGIGNLGSLIFFINALKYTGFDSSIIFSVNHLSVITLSVLTGLVVFRERLTLLNWIGVLLAFAGIIVLYQS